MAWRKNFTKIFTSSGLTFVHPMPRRCRHRSCPDWTLLFISIFFTMFIYDVYFSVYGTTAIIYHTMVVKNFHYHFWKGKFLILHEKCYEKEEIFTDLCMMKKLKIGGNRISHMYLFSEWKKCFIKIFKIPKMWSSCQNANNEEVSRLPNMTNI